MSAGAAVNLITLSDDLLARLASTIAIRPPAFAKVAGGFGVIARELLLATEVDAILAELDRQRWQPVGLDGIAEHYQEGVTVVGSWRATVDSAAFADILWQRLAPAGGAVVDFSGFNTVDSDGHALWRAVGLNPRLRCIRYETGGLLVPHYDAPFDYGDGRRTLRTVVLYLGRRDRHRGLSVHWPSWPGLALSPAARRQQQLVAWGEAAGARPSSSSAHHPFARKRAKGGATRFLRDPQSELPYAERDFSDWTRLAQPEEVLASVNGEAGDALIFNHRILHDSEPLTGAGSKTVLRTDIIFERVLKS